jgi:hypothetical protein
MSDIGVDSGAPVATLPCRGTWRRSPVQSSHQAQNVMEGGLSFQGKSTVSHTLLQFVFRGLAGLQLRKAEPQNLDVGTARPEVDDWTDSGS